MLLATGQVRPRMLHRTGHKVAPGPKSFWPKLPRALRLENCNLGQPFSLHTTGSHDYGLSLD